MMFETLYQSWYLTHVSTLPANSDLTLLTHDGDSPLI